MTPKLALHIIAKDEVEKTSNIIDKYGQYFDEIVIAADQELDRFSELSSDKVKIFPYKWCDDFAHKRNFLVSVTQSSHYFRLDTDDELENPQIIRPLFQQMLKTNTDVLFVLYDYAKDPEGNCIASHWRETIVKKRDDVYWNKKIHENLFLDDPSSVKMGKDENLKIIHNIDSAHAEASFERNFKYLMDEYKADGKKTDPRTVAYLGRMLLGKGHYKEAIELLQDLILRSGWNDDKYFAWIQMSQCFYELEDLTKAIACCNEALAINTKFPDAYLQLGSIYMKKGDYDKAVDWYMIGVVRPAPETAQVVDPSLYTFKAKANAALALLGKGDVKLACQFFDEAYFKAPQNPLILKYKPLFDEARNEDSYIKSLAVVGKYLRDNDPDKMDLLAQTIPQKSLKSERIAAIKNRLAKPKIWSDRSVVFYCGNSWEDWADCSTIKGIGGSEEAVIYLSRELVKLGWDVTVYNQCGAMAGVYNGVKYVNFTEFNVNDHFYYFVSWRNNIFRDTPIYAKQTILWLHDVPHNVSGKNGNLFKKVVVLSQFHKSIVPPNVDNTQIFVSSNGINTEDFKDKGIIRNPHRMIYTSSYDRGIEHLLMEWPQIKAAVPDAELHLFYGWYTYDELMKAGRRPPDFKAKMLKLMAQEGVYEHGRVGHKQLVRELQQSGVWVYPSHFEEISCISAMKAQAAGCVPVCTDYAALNETVKTGIKVHGRCGDGETMQEFKKELIKILKSEEDQERLRKEVLQYKDSFGWDKVAEDWTNNLLVLKPRQYSSLEEYEAMYRKANQGVATFKGVLPRYKWALEFVKKHNLKQGLDVGCFDASLAVYLITETNKDFKCDALDISDHGLSDARRLNDEGGLGMTFYTGNAFEKAAITKKYDVLFVFETLEHCINIDNFLKKCSSILSDNGYILITIPSKNGVFGYKHDAVFNDSHMIDWGIDEFEKKLTEHFSDVSVDERDGLLYATVHKTKVPAEASTCDLVR